MVMPRRDVGEMLSVAAERINIFAIVMPEWYPQGLCAQTDPEAFFPEKGGSTREAKKICAGCPVRQKCLDHALANHERHGIWGGLSERDRRKLERGAA